MQLAIRLSKKKKTVTTTTNVSRPVFYKEKESGQVLFCYFRLFYFFILSRFEYDRSGKRSPENDSWVQTFDSFFFYYCQKLNYFPPRG